MPAKQTDMITRRYEHPDGGRCMIRFPQGWSRKCYYESDAYKGEHGNGAGNPLKYNFSTPQQAREEAIAYEGVLLQNGWCPQSAFSRSLDCAEAAAKRMSIADREDMIAVLACDEAAHQQGPNYIVWLNQQCASLPLTERNDVIAEVLKRRAASAAVRLQSTPDARAEKRKQAQKVLKELHEAWPELGPVDPKAAAEFDQPKRRKIVLGD